MKNRLLISLLFPILLASCQDTKIPLGLHPDNPHYFLFRGKPAILIGSTEHYGAVMNLDFDYKIYLDELASKGLNVTRTFSGIYVEPQGAFGIAKNTLAPGYGRFICPWSRSEQPGYTGGGNKFDLDKWDDAYFVRLKDFIAEAGKRGIIVELDLFSNFYDTLQWQLSPLYYANNINNTEPVEDQKEVLSLRHPGLLKIQESMVKKIMEECNSFTNLYYEVCNEPYFGDMEALAEWQEHMTSVMAGIEDGLPLKHLISQNVRNGSFKVEDPHPAVGIFNFHYAKPPVTVEMNYNLNKPIGDNETGFRGIEDVHYRTEGWDFLAAGGALFNHLDYSFTVDEEDGSFKVEKGQPGGGGESIRNQLSILKTVFDELDFIKMKPVAYTLTPVIPERATVRILANEGKEYLVYIDNWHPVRDAQPTTVVDEDAEIDIPVDLPSGNYNCTWIDPVSGERTSFKVREHDGGIFYFTTKLLKEDLALLITR